MPHDPYKALYIHIPFCKSKCAYCDFCSSEISSDSKVIEDYIDDLVLQIRRNAKEGELADIETIYIGGGTPSHIGSKNLSKLLYAISTSIHLRDNTEFSMEANPESISPNLIRDIWALGVNRISIGVQSFDDEILNVLGRVHTSDDAIRAINDASERFENISIDLMCGLPCQTLDSFMDDLNLAVSLPIKHISIYPLTIEKGTKFEKEFMKGRLHIPSEDLQAEMMEAAATYLQDNGFNRYEVASYAKPGFESRHNLSYWSGTPYIGLGKSATSMTQNSERRMRTQDGMVVDDLSPDQMMAEDLMLAMRTSRGISSELLKQAKESFPQIDDMIDHLIETGLVEAKEGSIVPTDKGWLLGNELYGALLDLAP